MAGNAQLSIAIRAVNEASRQLKDVQGDIDGLGTKAGAASKHTSGLGKHLGDIGKIAGGFVIGQGLIALPGAISSAVGAASGLNESLSKSNTIFKNNAKEVEAWAATASRSFGQSKAQALDAAGSFGNMFTQLGIGTDVAAEMSMQMTELASDFASFHNADITEVINAQSAAFRGEYDALQRFVPTINAAAVETEALAMTGKLLTSELTLQEKALAVQSLMMAGAGEAMGDFDRTASGAANQQRILKAELANVQAEIGNAFLPAVVAIGTVFINDVMPAIRQFVDVAGPAVKQFMADVRRWWEEDGKPAVDNLIAAWEAVSPIILPILKQLAAQLELLAVVFGNTVGIIVDLISGDFSGAWEKAKNILRAFEEFFNATMENVKALVGALGTALFALGSAAIQALWDGIRSVAASLLDYFRDDLLGDMKYAASQVISFMLDIGENIVRGLWNGIKSMTGWLKGNIQGFAGDVIGSFRDGFGVWSPSRLTQVIGYELIEGLNLGIDQNTRRVIATVENVVDEVERTWNQTMNLAGRTMVDVMTGWMDHLADVVEEGGNTSENALHQMLNEMSFIIYNAGLPTNMRQLAERALGEMITTFREGNGVATQAALNLITAIMNGGIPAAAKAGEEVAAAFNTALAGAINPGSLTTVLDAASTAPFGERNPFRPYEMGEVGTPYRNDSGALSLPPLGAGLQWEFYDGQWRVTEAGTKMDFGGGSYTGPGGTYTGASWQPTTIVVNALDAQSFQQYLQNGGGEQIATYFNARTAY